MQAAWGIQESSVYLCSFTRVTMVTPGQRFTVRIPEPFFQLLMTFLFLQQHPQAGRARAVKANCLSSYGGTRAFPHLFSLV